MNKLLITSLAAMILGAQATLCTQEAPVLLMNNPVYNLLQKEARGDSENPTISTPFLVPFNQSLFRRYCTTMINRSTDTEWKLLSTFTYCSTFFSMLYAYPMLAKIYQEIITHAGHDSLPTRIGQALLNTTTHNLHFDSMISCAGTILRCMFGLSVLVSGLRLAGMCFSTAHALYTIDFTKEQEVWEANHILPFNQQELLWHAIIYEKFGKPAITRSTIDDHHQLMLQKKYGAGKVIFDPEDEEQIEILLGIHPTKQDDLRCNTLEIIPKTI